MQETAGDAPGPDRFPMRAAKARRTRLALITAATELFVEQGYAATTVEAIARRAGVSRPTVFTSVPGGKPQLLKEARDIAIAGDDEPVPITQREWLLNAMNQTDPAELLRLQAGNILLINGRYAALERALQAAAGTDPGLAELAQNSRHQRHLGAGFVARRLRELDALKPGLSIEEAADSIYVLDAPELYLMLVGDRGWSGARYSAWVADHLRHDLLAPAGSRPTPSNDA